MMGLHPTEKSGGLLARPACTRSGAEGDHEYPTPVAGDNVHVLRRGTKYTAAHYLRMIMANDERPRTLHAEAQRSDRALLPDIVQRLLDRQDQRFAARREVWRQQATAESAFYDSYKRLAADIGRAAERGMDRGYGLEL